MVETKEVQVTPENQGKPVEAMFELSQETPGLFSYELRVTPLQSEATLMDNRAPLLLRVLDRKIKILLVEGGRSVRVIRRRPRVHMLFTMWKKCCQMIRWPTFRW